jgi:hypothetical protein
VHFALHVGRPENAQSQRLALPCGPTTTLQLDTGATNPVFVGPTADYLYKLADTRGFPKITVLQTVFGTHGPTDPEEGTSDQRKNAKGFAVKHGDLAFYICDRWIRLSCFFHTTDLDPFFKKYGYEGLFGMAQFLDTHMLVITSECVEIFTRPD